MQIVRPYLRASTEEQDASRAEGKLKEFIAKHGMKVASWYRENASGARLDRPELQRLLNEAEKGDVLLVESIESYA
jgi:DNA invertase Pin-like site-specific DNA recombinase